MLNKAFGDEGAEQSDSVALGTIRELLEELLDNASKVTVIFEGDDDDEDFDDDEQHLWN